MARRARLSTRTRRRGKHGPQRRGAAGRSALARSFLSGDLSRRSFLQRAGGFSAAALSATSLGAVLAACSIVELVGHGTERRTGHRARRRAGGTLAGGIDRRARHDRPGDVDDLHGRAGLRQHLQQADRPRPVEQVLRPARHEVDRGGRRRPGSSTWSTPPRSTTARSSGRTTSSTRSSGSWIRRRRARTRRCTTRSRRWRRPGRRQVTFHLKTPFGPFLSNLANNGEIVNQKAIESKDPSRNAVGTGPFEFVEWVQGDHITLKKNDSYFLSGQALPRRDRVQVPERRPEPDRRAALGRPELVRRGAAPAAEHAEERSVVQLRDVGDGRDPRLHRDEHDAAAVRQQARPAGRLLGARPRRDPPGGVLRSGRIRDRGGADRLELVRRGPARRRRTPSKAQVAAPAGRGERHPWRSSTWACRSTRSC